MKEKIFNLVKRAVELSGQQGYSPDDAIRKVAEENNLNEDFVHRVVATYNTARTVNVFDKSADKTVKFALADPSNILAGRIQERRDEIKSPTMEKLPEHDYLTREAIFVDGDSEFEADLAKFAGEEVKEASASFTIFNPLMRHLETTTRSVEATKELRDSLYEQAFWELSKTAEDHVAPYKFGWDLSIMEAQAMNKLGAEFAKFAFDWIDAKAGGIGKRASAPDARRMVIWENKELGQALEKVANLFDLCAQVEVSFEAELQNLANNRQQYESLVKFAVQGRGEFDTGDPDSKKNDLNQSSKSQESADLTGAADSMSRVLDEANTMMAGTKERHKTLFDMVGREAPEETSMRKDVHEETENVRRSILLHGLLAHDPVLSQEDPKAVAQAYETLVNISPVVSLNPNLTRSILRTMSAQQSIGPFEGAQIAKLESELRKHVEPVSRKSPNED
jgi:hypothetical protein